MIRFLPFILIVVLILGGLGYWRFVASKSNLTSPNTAQSSLDTNQQEGPIEVPKTLPQASLEDRVKELEDVVTKLVTQLNSLKSQTTTSQSTSSSESSLSTVESAVTELKARVSALEKATPAPVAASSTQSSVYIPLGSGGGPWANTDWYSPPEYEISLDPANYPGYKSMILEVTFRLLEAAGTGSVRLYNVTDSSASFGQVDTTSSTFSLKTSSSFTLPTGSKTYRLQVKSSQNKDLYIQSARIKVNF